MRGASLGVVGALAAGLVLAPSGGATAAGADDSTDPVFHPVSTQEVAPIAGDSLLRARSAAAQRNVEEVMARAATAKSTQILQTWRGIQGAGHQGVSIAAGPKHVVQALSNGSTGGIRAFVKSTGAQPKGASKSLLQFFGLGTPATASQPSVVYDPVGKRFIAVAVVDNSGDVGLVMRISKGTAAVPLTKKKWLKPVEFAFSTSAEEEPGRLDVDESEPLIGVSSDKIAVTAVADDPSDASIANRIFMFPKTDYYKAANYKSTGVLPGGWASSVNSTYNGQAPAVNVTKQSNVFIAIPHTSDVTVTTYAGPATTSPPKFSKNVTFPSKSLVAPPLVEQGTGEDDLNLGGLAFTGVVWRKNKLYAATTVDSAGRAAVRVFGINTGSGVSLTSDKTLKSDSADWFNPDLAVDGAGNILLTANDEGSDVGPSLAVFAKKSGKWLSPKFVALATAVVSLPGDPVQFENTTGAALDPTSPWDVWIAGVVGNSGVGNGLLGRATPADTVALQRAPRSGGSFATIKNGSTAANGTAQWRVKVKKATRYRTLGKAVKQQGGAGRLVTKVTSKAVTVRLR